jgi:hypothetical protein
MLATGLEYGVRVLWTGAGVCTLTLGAVAETDWALRLVTVLCGILTLLLSLLLGGFVKHLVGHEAYSQALYAELDRRQERLFKALHGTVNGEQCKSTQKAMTASFTGQLDLVKQRVTVLEDKLGTVEQAHTRGPHRATPQGQ